MGTVHIRACGTLGTIYRLSPIAAAVRDSLPRLLRDYEIGELEEVFYKTAAGNARAIYYMDRDELARLLDDAEIATASLRLVAYMRSHGQVAGMHRRWHEPAFAAWLE